MLTQRVSSCSFESRLPSPLALCHLAFTVVCLALSPFIFPSFSPCRFVRRRYVGVSSPEVQHELTHMSQQCSLSTGCNDRIDRGCDYSRSVCSFSLFPPRRPLFRAFSRYSLPVVFVFSRPWLSSLDNSLPPLLMQFPASREQSRSVGQSDFLANIFLIDRYAAGGEILL